MASITRWEPLREARQMHDMLDRFISDAMADSVFSPRGTGTIPMDVYQTDDDIIVKATAPGFKVDDINISVTNDVLTIHGVMEDEQVEESAHYHLRERRVGSFSRSISLPTRVNADEAEAQFKNGILTLTLPKVEEVKPKTITIKAK